ncbi:hypothetical protein B9Z55_004558 [Caenorhabditis nigoni]|nr:hypothetical protein B9Z55_004558 [Caenorhabditis nigoni]
MAEKMIEIQDQYHYESHLAEFPVYTSDSEVSTSSTSPVASPTVLIPNPFYNPELAKKILVERQKKQMSPISPTGVQLVPNPFYNPELAKELMSKKSKKSMSKKF